MTNDTEQTHPSKGLKELKREAEWNFWKDQFEEKESEYRDRFPRVFEMLETVGLTKEPMILMNPYTNKPATRFFNGVYQHNLGVGIASDRIASALFEKGKITSEERDETIQRGLIHDANKPMEIMRAQVKGQDAFSQSAYDMELKLLEKKVRTFPSPSSIILRLLGKRLDTIVFPCFVL